MLCQTCSKLLILLNQQSGRIIANEPMFRNQEEEFNYE
jgi:hypothetical protein